jgi:hypothetical protein
MAVFGVGLASDERHAVAMNTNKNTNNRLRPRCGRIDPDADNKGYYCLRCGYDLIETKTGWFRHGIEWRHPEVWR